MTLSKIPSIPSINFSKIRLDIRSCRSKLVQWRRQFHIQPELGFQEQATGAFIAKTLTKIGIPHQTGIAKTGIVATITSPYPGPVLAIRSDIDALPIQEESEVPYRSQNSGIMHACGHDGHMASALGTAYYLWHHRHNFKGTVKIIFQPAEENSGGAKLMIDQGILKNPDVDAIIGLHLWNNFPLGTVRVSSGPLMAAVECFRLDIFGKGGHDGMPDQTVDSVVVSAQIVNALQTIVSRSVNPLNSAVVTVGELHAGTGLNVIADKARMSGTVRYFNPNLKGYFGKRIEEIVAGICQTFGATYELDYWWLYPPVINDEKMADLVRSVAIDVTETYEGIISSCQTMGGEDMSFFLQEIPGCYFFLGSANQDKGFTYPHHHPRFDFDETALLIGVEIFVRAAEKFCQ
ncbi:M20 metallopeptidase family protein [cyanobacterium endosymbiont of Epithemia clementina EcSB]|uniref:M20 metallopeptidase family protein n=1 Tax=cyanobacterium endosymbiont of Epithemia clementina EcSB TaxID=3034674 RepID=UPI0024805666|nr:M20 family metallopeptidase [cyanobacterium endosymbiont of Epithemia clementina EcSB]WGT67989.1 M20 family metallopeptidase [cyanobacterium endosymbiont of Epithemia clementina EcSB]